MNDDDTAHRVHAGTREAWRGWLAENHWSRRSVWLVSWKKHAGRPAVGYDEAVTEALAFGWGTADRPSSTTTGRCCTSPGASPAAPEWIAQAKRPETRRKRVDETASLARRGERADQWRPR